MKQSKKQLSQLQCLMGADAPYYSNAAGRSADTLNGFLGRFLACVNVPDAPQTEVFQLALWQAYCLQTLFKDACAQKSLVEVPASINTKALCANHNELSSELAALEVHHLDHLDKEIREQIYSTEKMQLVLEKPKSQHDGYFATRMKRLKALSDEAQPYAALEVEIKKELRALRAEYTEVFYPEASKAQDGNGDSSVATPPVSGGGGVEGDAVPTKAPLTEEEASAIKAKADELETMLKANSTKRDLESPAGQHYAYYKQLVKTLHAKFGDLEALADDHHKAQQRQGRHSGASGDLMEKAALAPGPNGGLDKIAQLVLDVESRTRGGGKKYDVTKWAEIGAKAWFHCCQTMTIPGTSTPLIEGGATKEEAVASFQGYCRSSKLPFLLLLNSLKYNTTFTLAGEFDGLVVDALDNEVLLLAEVKANPADLIKARTQRVRIEEAIYKVLNPPPPPPPVVEGDDSPPPPPPPPIEKASGGGGRRGGGRYGRGKEKKVFSGPKPPKPYAAPAISFRGLAESLPSHLPVPAIDVNSFVTFLAHPVLRWAYITASNPPAYNPPMYAPFVHIAFRELVVPLSAALAKVLTTFKNVVGSGAPSQAQLVLQSVELNPEVKTDRAAAIDRLFNPDYLKGALPYLDTQPFVASLRYQWKSAMEANAAFESPDALVRELESCQAPANLVLVELDYSLKAELARGPATTGGK